MSATILSNSAALNSLQRSQLIKLCKRYGIKASGKNHELVAKLEAYGQTLEASFTFTWPSEADLVLSDDDLESDNRHLTEQSGWEQVSQTEGGMEQPVSNSDSLGVPPRVRSGTVGSWRSGKSSKSSEEFGKPGTSSKSSSIASSFKSFATNLIPGRSHKPVSAPAPESARVPSPPLPPQLRDLTPPRELTPTPPQTPEQGPTTVRLIPSPGPNALLPRSKSAADLLEGLPLPTPTLNKIATDLAGAEKILNGEEEPVAARVSFGFGSAGYDDGEEVGDVSMASISKLDNENQGDAIAVLAGLPTATTSASTAVDPPDQPFVFGHPRHSVTNTQFGDAAAAVLREMNARMGVTSPAQAVSIEQLEGVMANAGKSVAPLKVDKKADVRFGNVHQKEFAKMDSIANHYSVQAKKRKSEHTTAPATTTDDPVDKIFTLPPHLANNTESPRTAKRARISTADGSEPTSSNKVLTDSPAVRAQLEKRRSSAAARSGVGVGRKSGGAGARKSGAGAAASKGGFGFMKMVRGIWGSKPKEPEKPKVEAKKPSPPPTTDTKKFPNAPTHEPVTLPSVPKTRVVSVDEGKKVGLGRPSGSGAGRAVSQGDAKKTESGTIGRSRGGSSLYAPTAASLARQGAAVKPTTNGATKTGTLRSRAATTGAMSSSTSDAPKPTAARPLPVPPTTVGRATTSNAATQGSARMVSPPARAASTTGVARKSVASTSTGRKSTVAQPGRKSVAAGTRSPTGTGLARSPTGGRKSIFSAPLTVDAMTLRGSAPTVQPFRLSPQGNLNPAADEAVDAPKSTSDGAKPNGALGPRSKSRLSPSPSKPSLAKPSTSGSKPPVTRPAARRPRISRSKVIARLGEKRAAASVASPSNKARSPVGKARSSLQVRRSMGAVAAKRALDADKIRARRSEAANRRSRIVEGHGLAGRRSEGAVLRRRGMD